MKKVLIGMVALVCVMSVVCFGAIINVKKSYEVRLAEATSKYEDKIQNLKDKSNESQLRITELEDAIYSIMMDEEYNVTIIHDDETHTFKREFDDFNIFSRVGHNIGY